MSMSQARVFVVESLFRTIMLLPSLKIEVQLSQHVRVYDVIKSYQACAGNPNALPDVRPLVY